MVRSFGVLKDLTVHHNVIIPSQLCGKLVRGSAQ